MTDPHFSIVIATYNRPTLLARAVESVLTAASLGWRVEIIVADDCSTEPLPVFRDPSVTVLRTPKNSGPGLARMIGLRAARAPWVVILDDDDLLVPETFEIVSQRVGTTDPERHPVHMFRSSNGRLFGEPRGVTLTEYICGTHEGDFTAVVSPKPFVDGTLAYPPLRIGGENLLWWEALRSYGEIPFWNEKIVEVTDDASTRLTRPETQIKQAAEHWQLAELKIERFGDDLRRINITELHRIQKARFTYALLAGMRKEARTAWFDLPAGMIKPLLYTTLFLPRQIVQGLFIAYRKLNLIKMENGRNCVPDPSIARMRRR